MCSLRPLPAVNGRVPFITLCRRVDVSPLSPCRQDNGRRASEQGELLESGSAERDSAAASEDTSGPVVSLITSTSEGQSLTGVVIGGTPRAVDDDITVNNHVSAAR